MNEKKSICIVATVEVTLASFVIPAARVMKENGWDVTLACNMSDKFLAEYSKEFTCVNVPMSRGSSFMDLLKMPFYFKRLFKQGKYDMVQYATPNASLYASLGAKWAGVKKRLYCQWGIRYVGFSGFQRTLFKAIEKLTCKNSTHIRPASWKNLDFAVEEGLYMRENAAAIGDGGTIGIDMKQFDVSQKTTHKELVLEQYPQLDGKTVFSFVGRLNRDKGVFELLEAFQRLCTGRNDVALLQIGDMEGELPPHLEAVRQNKNVVLTGWTNEVPKYISASDILVHPSYREGFSMVIQQAMAMEIPVVTTDIPGPSEVIEPNVSGLLAKARDVETLYNCMKWMLEHPEEREQMGKAGRKRCEEKFNRERMLRLILEDRENILKA